MSDILRDPETGLFLKGKKGGPGRPKGSRNKLGEAFLADMLNAWELQGKQAITDMIEQKPGDFVKVVASLLPAQAELTVRNYDDMSDEELHERIRNLAAQLGPFLSVRVGDADEGTGGKARKAKSAGIH